jgi:DNA-directed RNA polymerase subunit RPC12/RpoP
MEKTCKKCGKTFIIIEKEGPGRPQVRCDECRKTSFDKYCETCGEKIIITGKGRGDNSREYCDDCRVWSGGRWRKKGYIKKYCQDHARKNIRQTRKTGTGFSEHIRWDRKENKPDLETERRAVSKEKKRIGLS